MRQRLVVLAGVLAIVAAACGGGPATTAPQAQAPGVLPCCTKVSVAYSNISGDDLSLWVTFEAGIFKKHGLDVSLQYINGGAQTAAALVSNSVNIAQFGGGEVLGAVAGGADLVMIAQLAPVYPYKLYVAKGINTIADLKGKSVGISNAGGSSDIATRDALTKNGLDPDKDVNLVAVGSHSNRTAALLTGAIAAGLDDPPGDSKLVKAGLKPLIDLAGQKISAANTAAAVQRSYLKANKNVLQAYIDALVEGIAYQNKNKDFTIGVLKKYFKLNDAATLDSTYEFFVKEVTPAYPFASPEQLTTSVAILAKKNPKVKDVDLNKVIDRSFMQSAQDRKVGQ
ncbi:MAG: ABC transporter substrate-binding protein [Candidatus Limnocylindria bacterium]